MDKKELWQWCSIAVSEIRFPPDKNRVYKELADHMDDRYENLLAEGCDEATAQKRTLEAMGSATEVAAQLGKIHRPFWGYFLQITRRLLVILLAITVIPLSVFLYNLASTSYRTPSYDRFDPYEDTYLSDAIGTTQRVMYKTLSQQANCRGYRVRLTEAVWTKTQHFTPAAEENNLYFRMEIKNPLPWAEMPDILENIWGRDSNGNIYYPFASGHPDEGHLSGWCYQTGLTTWVLEMQIINFTPENIKWLEIYYDRDGTSFSFQISLPGGRDQ